MNIDSFRLMLQGLNVAEMAGHSTLNHHVDGMHYLCLHRSEALTAKVYLIDGATNANSKFLVHPHSHRYMFHTTVLAGAITHIRFWEKRGRLWDRHRYTAETRGLEFEKRLTLTPHLERFEAGRGYLVTEDQIHTLRLVSRKPVVLGLLQFADRAPDSVLYLPHGGSAPHFPTSRRPTPSELADLRDRALALIET